LIDLGSGSRAARRAVDALAASCLPVLVWVWPRSFEFVEDAEVRVKAVLCLLVTLLVVRRELDSDRLGARRAGWALALAATLSVAAWFNFGWLHGKSFLHHWEQFHYHLGSKYFPELGYDGLYVASLGAQADVLPSGRVQTFARDLRTYQMEHVHDLVPHMQEVYGRFTPERWHAFVADNQLFIEANSLDYLGAIRMDHGFNGSPAWTFVARLFDAWLPTSNATLTALASLDLLLLAAMFAVVFATYGARIGCLSLVVFGLGYASRFSWIGGAYLRLDWLAASVIAVCLLERGRPFSSGALFGYATAVRVFPVLFLLGPAVLAARSISRGQRPRWALRLGAGFSLAIALGAAAGSLSGRGPQAWLEFGGKMQLHAGKWLTNNVGLSNLVLYDRAILERRDVDWSLPEPWLDVQTRIAERRQEHRFLIAGAQLALLLLLVAAVWRASLAEAALAGMIAIFALGNLTCYYWILLLAVPLRRSVSLVFAILLLNLGLHLLHFQQPAFEMRYGLMSWGLALIFLGWGVADALRRRASAESEQPHTAQPARILPWQTVQGRAGPLRNALRGGARAPQDR
jgi:hypothetical protein